MMFSERSDDEAPEHAFTVLQQEGEEPPPPPPPPPPARTVNVVKPLQRNHLSSADREPPQTILDPNFSRALDFKLRRLKDKETTAAAAAADVSPRRRRREARERAAGEAEERPRFVTTVRTGRFLLPPPEVAALLGLESLYPPPSPPPERPLVYSYSSRPRALQSRPRRAVPPPPPPQPGEPRQPMMAAARAFGGVRALVAGVVGMRSHYNYRDGPDHGPEGANNHDVPYGNIMHERRVVRGSNFAQPHRTAGAGDAESAAERAARCRRRAAARRAAAARLRAASPPPAPGRKHLPIQTEYYLEELFDKGEEMEVGVQTELFLDRPATPVYVPAKTGQDAGTQIYPGELFDFDLEVQPILEVLVGKTVEQALVEVAQEEELATLREQQRRFVELRDAERAERERLAEQERRLDKEKERRVCEARTARVTAVETAERAAAATLVQGYLADLLPSVLAGLHDQGYLIERLEHSVDEDFLPWLTQAVSAEVESIITSRDVITEIVREVVEARAERHRAAGELARAEPAAAPTPPSTDTLPGSAGGEGEEEAVVE